MPPTAALELPSGVPQFFFDDTLIGHQHHIARRWMQAKICPNPILKPDKPWEGRILSFYGSVFAEPEGGYRLYYTNFIPSGVWATTANASRAISSLSLCAISCSICAWASSSKTHSSAGSVSAMLASRSGTCIRLVSGWSCQFDSAVGSGKSTA